MAAVVKRAGRLPRSIRSRPVEPTRAVENPTTDTQKKKNK